MKSLLSFELENVSTEEARTNPNNVIPVSPPQVTQLQMQLANTGCNPSFLVSVVSFSSSSSRTDKSTPGSDQKLSTPKKRRGIRHSQQVLFTLNEWFLKHSGNPYPTVLERTRLCVITVLDMKQVTDWFANARRSLKNRHKKSHNQGIPCKVELCKFVLQFPFLKNF